MVAILSLFDSKADLSTHAFDSSGFATKKNSKGSPYEEVKYIFDLLVASIAILFLAPFLLIVAVLIKLDSRGPVLFSQTRWGRGGQKIKVFKFRTMFVDQCDASGVTQTVKGDTRITPIGAFLRRTNIDELPQLFNVLRGDMSLVGPRCHAVGMLAAGMPYEQLVPQYHRRHAVRPGITGLAQMRGLRGPTDRSSLARARIAFDIYYVEHQSLLLDLKIIFGTILSELRNGKGF
ncbi:sugar transferase [Sinorhizobium sp. BG8]|uniref:sugar transferase n=1 Tax=Sinorhizobium sp. BG8 TaxID=2613773 RepID=UPI00193CD6A6|nr:sugar transferase [Sinorhizobium sp. BG8]QRM53579.1 sugar transferase [Sinorhizobium sp. BG8]